jgi:hypothetical protein
MVGTMIEVPRGALTADEIAQTAEFFSFGTNDLTQTALGISRDDMGSVPHALHGERDLQEEPLRHARRQTGVGQLIKIAITKGRKTRPTSSWASAASTVATLIPLSSAIVWASLCELQSFPSPRRTPCRCAGRDRGKARSRPGCRRKKCPW